MMWYMKAITLTFFTKHWFPPEMIQCYEDIVHSSSCCWVHVESRYWSHLIVVHGTLACDMMWLELSTKFCGAAVFQICKDGAFPSSTLKILLRLCWSWDAWLSGSLLTKLPSAGGEDICRQAKLPQNFFDSSRCDVTCITVLRILSCIACLTLQDQTLQCIFMLPSVDPSIDPVSTVHE